jgi:hypothetical protein
VSSGQLRRFASALTDFVIQRTFTETATLYLAPKPGQTAKTEIEFRAQGGPLEIEVTYSLGGVPQKFVSWTNQVPGSLLGTLSKVEVDWTTPAVILSVEGTAVSPYFEVTGSAAADRAPPEVAAIVNPATGNVTILARDNFTSSDRLQFFLVQDSTGNGDLFDEVFYELGTNKLVRARLPSRLFTIVARDELGNVSSLQPLVLQTSLDFGLQNVGTGGYCDDLAAIRNEVQSVIQASLNVPALAELFLLDRSHLWVFEQGSGACLWKQNSCQECNGNFMPGVSDNDYQLFLPVHLLRNYQFTATDRLEFLADDPYDQSNFEGDWYFKPPVGLNSGGAPTTDPELVATWEYTLPSGFTTPTGDTVLFIPKIEFTGDLRDGFPVPLQPAEILALAFTQVVEGNERLPQTTFFPVRREHFMFGAFDLELPPPFGSDPLGDAGAGRQMLLLKWALEGEFVTLPGTLGVNQNLPSMSGVYENVKSFGIPIVEGLEWGLSQEYFALKSGIATDLKATYGDPANAQPLHSAAGNDLEKIQRKKLKTMGKAAIRAGLARLAGDPETASLVFSIDRQNYISRKLPSFEDFILTVITNSGSAQEIFGPYGQDRPADEGPDIFDFLSAKKGTDEKFFDDLFSRPDGYRKFVLGGIDFLRNFVQAPTLPAYDSHMDSLLVNEAQRSY